VLHIGSKELPHVLYSTFTVESMGLTWILHGFYITVKASLHVPYSNNHNINNTYCTLIINYVDEHYYGNVWWLRCLALLLLAGRMAPPRLDACITNGTI